jgi:hypothetical protein
MSQRPRHDRDPTVFVPRIALTIVTGLLIFVAAALLYSLPVMLEEPPPGAIADWTRERVRAHLEGKVTWLLAGSFVVAALLAARGWIPGTGRGRP